MITNLYLARHGQTQWNKVHRFQGQLDSELTQMGKQQSEQIALHFSDQQVDLIVSSSLGRAVETAKICQRMLNAPVTTLSELIERNLGFWQGQYIDKLQSEINYHEILHQFTEVAPPSGESALSCGTRIYETLNVLAKNNLNKELLVIFHGEALRCFLAKLGHNSTDNAYKLFDNGCVIPLTYLHDNDIFQLVV